MYQAVMLRKRKNRHSGFYVKNFESLEKLAKYIMSPVNLGRCYKLRGLTVKEQRIFNYKCYSIDCKENKL